MSDALESLLHWERSGGTWQSAGRRGAEAVVVLCRCDGGEEVDRLISDDPALTAYLERRASSAEPEG